MKDLESKEIIDLVKAADGRNGKIEVTILNGEARKLLPEVKPIEKTELSLFGNISTVYNFLHERHGLFNPNSCNISVDINELKIKFIGNEQSDNNDSKTKVVGTMEKSKELTKIPLENDFQPSEFAKYVRRNKSIFSSTDQWNKIFKSYSSFKAKVDKEFESSKDRSGNAADLAIQKVQTDLIQEFDILIPLIEGGELITIRIEVDINPNLTCSLFAPDLESQLKSEINRIMQLELSKKINDKPMSDFCVTYYK